MGGISSGKPFLEFRDPAKHALNVLGTQVSDCVKTAYCSNGTARQ